MLWGRQRILSSPRCVGKAMYHHWTPVAALTQVFIAILSCCVYASHSVTTSQDTSHGVGKGRGKCVCITERESQKDRQKCLLSELSKQAFGPFLTAAAIGESEVQLWLPDRRLTSELRECTRLDTAMCISDKEGLRARCLVLLRASFRAGDSKSRGTNRPSSVVQT